MLESMDNDECSNPAFSARFKKCPDFWGTFILEEKSSPPAWVVAGLEGCSCQIRCTANRGSQDVGESRLHSQLSVSCSPIKSA